MRSLQGRVPLLLVPWGSHAIRTPPHLRSRPPALYHLFLLSTTAESAHWARTRPIRFHSRRNSSTIPLRSCRVRNHAGALSLTNQRTRSWESINGDASSKTTYRPCALAEKRKGTTRDSACCSKKLSVRRSGKRASMTSMCGRRRSGLRSSGICIATR